MLLVLASITACVDTDFDEPDTALMIPDDKIVSIASILEKAPSFGGVELTDELLGGDEIYLKATVTADDASGNFYKTLYFQDETGALTINPDQSELNAAYAEGNIIYVKLNGLYIAKDYSVPKLAYGIDGTTLLRIPDALVWDFLFGGKKGPVIEPEVITLAELNNNSAAYFNKLVTITGVEFTEEFLGGTYAIPNSPDGPITVNTYLQDCAGSDDLLLRNSGFATFAGTKVPTGNGSITGIPNRFNDDIQFFIRDTDDVAFSGDRCDGSSGGGDFPTNELDLGTIKENFLSQGVDQIEEGFIQGVVISTDNITNKNLIFQSGDVGIILRFASAHSYQLGQKLKVNVSGYSVSEFNGGTQIDGLSPLAVQEDGTSTLPTPANVTVDELLSDIYKYESVRVKLSGVTLGKSVFEGGMDITDGTSTIGTFIQDFASFYGQAAPSGSVDVVGYGSYYNAKQIIFNSASDVTGGGGTTGGDGEVSQNFDGKSDFDPVNYPGWLNLTVKGNKPWYFRTFDDNGFAECEAFQADDAEIESWLITPSFDTDDKSVISFETAQAFWKHQGLSVWVSPDFDDVADANWTEITEATIANDSDPQYDFIPSGDIDIKTIVSGEVRIGWKYVGTSANSTTKMRLDNVVLK